MFGGRFFPFIVFGAVLFLGVLHLSLVSNLFSSQSTQEIINPNPPVQYAGATIVAPSEFSRSNYIYDNPHALLTPNNTPEGKRDGPRDPPLPPVTTTPVAKESYRVESSNMPESSLGTVVILADERTERVSIWNNGEVLHAIESCEERRSGEAGGGEGGGSLGWQLGKHAVCV